jgi:hypothetical protein
LLVRILLNLPLAQFRIAIQEEEIRYQYLQFDREVENSEIAIQLLIARKGYAKKKFLI